MATLFWILGSTIMISLLAWVGVFVLFLNEKLLNRMILWLVSFAAGAMLAGSFFHLIPEAIAVYDNLETVFFWVAAGFALFLLLEQFLHWHHCHQTTCDQHHSRRPVTYLVLLADSVHNFIDGLVIAGAFLADIKLGIVTVLVMAAHEIPQELGDFGILIHGGWQKFRALWFNFASAFTVVLGGLTAYFISAQINIRFLLPLAAGTFIYIAASDLIPEIKHHDKLKTNLAYFVTFLWGLAVVWLVGLLES